MFTNKHLPQSLNYSHGDKLKSLLEEGGRCIFWELLNTPISHTAILALHMQWPDSAVRLSSLAYAITAVLSAFIFSPSSCTVLLLQWFLFNTTTCTAA